MRDPTISGGLIWSLRFHNDDGGFYWHFEPHGGDFFPALFQAIKAATTAICAEFYIIKSDETGLAFADAPYFEAIRQN